MQVVTTLRDRQSGKVEMVKVESSNLSEIGYSERTARLFVRFRDGGKLYFYDPCPSIIWLALLFSRSKGRFLSNQIIPFFRCTKAKEADLQEESRNGKG